MRVFQRLWLLLLCGLVLLQGYMTANVLATYRSTTLRVQSVSAATPTPCAHDPSNPPDSVTFDLDQDAADWGVFCEGAPTWVMQQIANPSLDGASLRCGLTGGTAYSNIHCYRDLLPEPASAVFTYTVSFRFNASTVCNNQNAASVIQALEFTVSKWDQSQRYEFALQWQNVGEGAPQWRYWNPYESSGNKWVPLSPPINQCLTSNTWHTITLLGDIRNKQVHYQAFIIDNQHYEMNISVEPFPTDAHDHLAIAVQLDGNYAETPYDLFIDKVSLVRAAVPPMQPATPTPTTSVTATPVISATSTPTPSITPTTETAPSIIPRFYLPLIMKNQYARDV